MNLLETRLLLSEAWSLYPALPRLMPEEKRLTAIAWFRTLCSYSYEDARNAFRRAAAKNPHYMPSAFEVLDECVETIDADAFLTAETKALEAQRKNHEYTQLFSDNFYIELNCLKCERDRAETPERRADLNEMIENNVKLYHVDAELHDLRSAAYAQALAAYHNREAARAADDFNKICTMNALSVDNDF